LVLRLFENTIEEIFVFRQIMACSSRHRGASSRTSHRAKAKQANTRKRNKEKGWDPSL